MGIYKISVLPPVGAGMTNTKHFMDFPSTLAVPYRVRHAVAERVYHQHMAYWSKPGADRTIAGMVLFRVANEMYDIDIHRVAIDAHKRFVSAESYWAQNIADMHPWVRAAKKENKYE